MGISLAWARPNSAVRAFNEGVKLFNAKQFNEAIPRFDEAISNDREFTEAYFARGACKYYLKSLDGALLDLNDALRLKPDNAEARALRGAVHYEADRWDAALEDFNDVLQMNPREAQSLLGRAVILLKREDRGAAEKDFKAFLRLRPEDPMAPKVRQLLASQRPAVVPGPARQRAAAASPPESPRDLQKLADSLLAHPLSKSYDRKVLRGEKAEAIGDIHSVPGLPRERQSRREGMEIVEPQ